MRIFTLLAMIIAMNCYAQDQQGYYIDNTGRKTEGFFKTADFYNEQTLEFKTAPDKEFTKLNPENIRGYGIANQFKFEKHNVRIDRSNTNTRQLSANKDPQWEYNALFLNVLVEGNATLYSYNSDYGIRFFYSLKDKIQVPEQLVYKKYKVSETSIAENNQFRQQIFSNLNCDAKDIKNFTTLEYSEKKLRELVKAYNSCSGSQSIEYSNSSEKKGKLIFTIHAGIHNMSFGMTGPKLSSDKETVLNFAAGAEVAFRLPSEKWELFLRGEYEPISADIVYNIEQAFNNIESTYKIDGSNFNFYVGPRYNYVLSGKSKMFFDGSLGVNLASGEIVNTVYYTSPTGNYDGATTKYSLTTCFFANLGVGYTFNDKYGVCLRYESNRNLLNDISGTYKTNISRIGLNLRYTF